MRNVFANKSIREKICQGRNAFLCNVMKTNQGTDMLRQAKSHVETARESHYLKPGLFAASNSFAYRIPMQNYSLSLP